MNKVRFFIYIIISVLFSTPFWGAQLSRAERIANIYFLQDSIVSPDSIIVDAISTDTIGPEKKKDPLDAPVDYTANDSIIFDMTSNHGYLFGESNVDYTIMSIKAENIIMSMDSSIIHATYGIDSIGKEFGHPVFREGDTEYEMENVSYNFKSQKGYIKNVITKQGEGYIVADLAKKNADDSFFMCNGKYTTCDQHDHPHFYMMLTKAKVRPKKNVVTGPAYFVLEDLPLPLAIPFGFFPFTDSYSSGVIMPSYGEDMDRGFNLRNGGYYFAINDYIDLALTGEIYTKGSWGLAAKSTYKKRYRHSGSFDINYLYTKYGDKSIPDTYSVAKDFKFTWNHTQDPKANMYRTLSANVNYSTTTFNRYNQESLYNPNEGTASTKSSSVTLTQRFPNSPFSINANVTVNQRSKDSTIAVTFPNLTVTMSRIYPFKRKNAIGPEKWFEKIQMSYTGDFRNSIETKDDQLFKSNLVKDWKNGMQHRIPISATFTLFDYINITPSFNYRENWYSRKITQEWDPQLMRGVAKDTTYSFYRTYDFNYSLSLQTKLYGFYEPAFKMGKIKTIRHVFTPSIGFSGNPDFSDPVFGAYKSYKYYDSKGQLQEERYSPYSGQVFAPPGKGKSGNINFSFENNVEMKVATDNDSTKIVSLIDNLSIGFSYNTQAPEYKWSDINASLRLKLSKSLMVNINSVWDPYSYEWDPALNGPRKGSLRLSKYGTIARLKSTSYSISPSINQDTFKKLFGKKEKSSISKEDDGELLDEDDDPDSQRQERRSNFSSSTSADTSEYDQDGYLKNDVRWNLGISYSMSYSWDNSIAGFDRRKNEYKSKITHNLSLNGSIQPTKNWNFTFTTSYDFDNNKFAYLNCTLGRNLHCWNLSASFIPIGPYTSYYVTVRVNSSMLQDLKYEQRSRASSFDPTWD